MNQTFPLMPNKTTQAKSTYSCNTVERGNSDNSSYLKPINDFQRHKKGIVVMQAAAGGSEETDRELNYQNLTIMLIFQ